MSALPFLMADSDKLKMPRHTRRRCRPPMNRLLSVASFSVASLQCCTAFWAPPPNTMGVRQRELIRVLPDTSCPAAAATAAVGGGGGGGARSDDLSCCRGRLFSSLGQGDRENVIRTRRLVGGGGGMLRCSASSGELLASDVAEPAGSDEVRGRARRFIESRFLFLKCDELQRVSPISTAQQTAARRRLHTAGLCQWTPSIVVGREVRQGFSISEYMTSSTREIWRPPSTTEATDFRGVQQ